METVDGLHRTNVKFLNQFNRVSFAFAEQRNAKRSESIAKRSKTPLKKSNSLMVLRNIGMIEVSAASPVDVTSSDDVASTSCSIVSSPVSTASTSTGKSQRRLLPSLPTQKTVQESNGASVNGGVKKAGLRRHESCAWPSRSGAVNHRSIDNVNHRSTDNVNHRSIDNVNRQWTDSVKHRQNNSFSRFSNDVTLLPSESVNLPGDNITSDLCRRDHVNQRPNDLVNYHQSDLISHRPGDTVAQCPNASLHGSIRVQKGSISVAKTSSDSHHLRDSLHLPRNDSVGHHKSDKVIHLQGQSDSQLKDASFNYYSNETQNHNTSQNVLQRHNDNTSHSQSVEHRSGVKVNTVQDETVRRGIASDNRNDVANISQCIRRDSRDVSSYRQNVRRVASLKISSVSLHDDSSQRVVGNNIPCALTGPRLYACNPNEDLSHFQREKVNPRNTQSDIHSSSDSLFNQCPKEKEKENSVSSLSADYVAHKLRPIHQEKLHSSSSSDEKSSSAEHRSQFQLSDAVRQNDMSLDSNLGAPSKVSYYNDIIPIEASTVPTTRSQILPAFLQTQANPRLSELQASSVDDNEEETENDDQLSHKKASKDIGMSLQQENTFQPQGQVQRQTHLDIISKGRWSPNYLHSQSQQRPEESQILCENNQQSSQNLKHSPAPRSSDSLKNLPEPRTTSKNQDAKSPIQDAATRRKLSLLNSKNNGSLDTHRKPSYSEIQWSSSQDIHIKSLATIPDPEYFPTNLTKGSETISGRNSLEEAYGLQRNRASIADRTDNSKPYVPEAEIIHVESSRGGFEQVDKDGFRGATPATSLCVPTLHALLQTCRMAPVSLVRSTAREDCGVTLATVPFGVDTVTYRRPAGLTPKGKRATNLGSPNGAFRPVTAAETSPGRDVQPQIVIVTGVEDGSVAAASGSIEEGDFVVEVNGTFVLGSSFDVVERLLNINSQRLDFVLAKPYATASQKSMFNTDGQSANPPGIVQCLQDEQLLTLTTSGQPHSALQHVPSNCQPQRTIAGNGIIIKPTTIVSSSNRSCETAYTMRPIKEDFPSESAIVGFNQTTAFQRRRDSYNEMIDYDYEWQKISAV